jgi:hypothetical protein
MAIPQGYKSCGAARVTNPAVLLLRITNPAVLIIKCKVILVDYKSKNYGYSAGLQILRCSKGYKSCGAGSQGYKSCGADKIPKKLQF